MRIIIINLASQKQRFAFQEKQLGKLGLSFDRFEAITPQTLPDNIPQTYWQSWERPLRLEERACFLSHRTVWQSIVDTDKPALILEDDVYLSNKLPNLLSVLGALGSQIPIQHISLEVRNRKKLVSSKSSPLLDGDINLHQLYQDRSGAAAYILWPNGAKKLIDQTQKKAGLADAIICRTYSLHSLQVEPACAVQFDVSGLYNLSPPFETTSGTNLSTKQARYSTPQFLIYRTRRITSQLRMGMRRFSCLFSASRRGLKLNPDDFIK